MLLLHWKAVLATALCAAALSQPGLAQVAPTTILQVDVENNVDYKYDTADPSRFGADPALTTTPAARPFQPSLAISDIVAVNGKPVKGTLTGWRLRSNLTAAATPGQLQAIADTERQSLTLHVFEIMQIDGTPIGTIMAYGVVFGPLPPGGISGSVDGNLTVMGGTGAFLGVRGQAARGAQTSAIRNASQTEDPANRRVFGGGKSAYVLHLIPMERPEIASSASGPAVFHADLSPVTAAKPVKAGEVLIVRATGLGPTRPGVDPGQPFPTDALQDVNSPLAVWVNGKPADVINGIGWPGQLDTYRVDFRVPDGIAPGTASIQLTAAWIAGSGVNVPVQ